MSTAYLTVPEVAAILRVDPKTVRADIRAGRLRAIRVGDRGQYRVPEDALGELPGAAAVAAGEAVTPIRPPRRARPAKVETRRFR